MVRGPACVRVLGWRGADRRSSPATCPATSRDALTAAASRTTRWPTCSARPPTRRSPATRPRPASAPRRGGSPLETLTRLWLLQAPVPAPAAEAALPGLVDRLCAAGILERSVGEVAARRRRPSLRHRPGGDGGNLWVASDLTPGLDGAPNAVGADHVLGISSASTSLAELTVRDPVGRALDLGTGCGVQALHLAAHARQRGRHRRQPRARSG